MTRPPVSIVVPFAGSGAEAEAMLGALEAVARGPQDELIVVDNGASATVAERPGVRVVRSAAEHSAYHARNAGAAVARTDWLLFTDADCRPRADLLDRYFDPPPDMRDGAVVGEVEGDPAQVGLVPRYSRSRGHLTQRMHVEFPFRPFGVTANLLVRRAAWKDVGGFHEGIRSTGDVELCWRLQDAGWAVGYRPGAIVAHAHRESPRALARQAARYGAGRAWIHRRYPQGMPLPRVLAPLARAAGGTAVWVARGERERARFKALDGLYVAAEWAASWLGNRPPGARPAGAARVVAVAGEWPARGAAAIDADRVEATARPVRVDRAAAAARRAVYAEDDGRLERLAAVAALALRRPRALWRAGVPPASVAPAARRVMAAGAVAVVPADDASRKRAAAVAALAGVPLRDP